MDFHSKEDLPEKLDDWTDEDWVAFILDELDIARLDLQGGYPSQYEIENGKVYIATIEGECEPSLEIYTVQEFKEEYAEIIFEYFEALFDGKWITENEFIEFYIEKGGSK